MTWSEFEDNKPVGMTDESFLRSLSADQLTLFAAHMREFRPDRVEYGHIHAILDELVPVAPVK